jgi:hypothetical protein
MTRTPFHPDQVRDSRTQKPRSVEVIRGATTLLGERRELLAEGELDDRLLASASEEGRDASKGDRDESEQLPHSEAHSERVRHPVRD